MRRVPDPRDQRYDFEDSVAIGAKEALGVLRRFWRFVRPYRGKFFLAILMIFLAVPLAQFALFLTRDVTNQALLATELTVDERWNTVLRIVGLQAVFFLASAVLSTWREVLEWYCSMKSTFDLRLAFYRHLHGLPMGFLSKRTPGEHLYRSTTDMVSMFRSSADGVALSVYSNDVDPYDPGMMGMIVRTVPLLVETLYGLLWAAILLSLIDPALGVALVLYAVPFAYFSQRMYDKVRRTAFGFKHRTEIETGVLRDSLAGLRTLKALGRLPYQLQRYFRAAAGTRRRAIQQAYELVQTQNMVQGGLKWAFGTTIYVYVAARVLRGEATLGDWVATFLLVEAAQIPLEKFVQLSQLVRMQLVPAQRVLETLDEPRALQDVASAQPMPPIKGRIEFDQVQFAYTPEVPVLRGTSFCIEPGEYVGIVGPSGAGKSSLLNLLLRLYAPQAGGVLVDGIDVRDVVLQTLLDQTATVPQSAFLYSGTIEDNILFGNPKATREQIANAAQMAGLGPLLERLPEGLNTEVSEGGKLSGGERQRIGIARALVREPRILILDEATASLDPATEEHVLQTIDRVRAGRTVLSIAHRLKAVRDCDRILVLEAGQVTQQGTHEVLMAQDGLYRRLWAEQMHDMTEGVGPA